MLKVGEIYETNNCGKLVITDYVSWDEVHYRFLSTGYEGVARADHIREGNVKDKLVASVCNVGFLGDGPYKAGENGKITKAYTTWGDMIRRCYSQKHQAKYPTYAGCQVCEEWHNFQNFAEWFVRHYPGKGYDLDKDTLSGDKRGKLYSPETCRFVEHQENSAHSLSQPFRVQRIKDGIYFNGDNRNEFCKLMGLDQGNFNRMVNGKQKTCKGFQAM